MTRRPILLIVNPSAGSKPGSGPPLAEDPERLRPEALASALRDRGLEVELNVLADGDDAGKLARRAAEGGSRRDRRRRRRDGRSGRGRVARPPGGNARHPRPRQLQQHRARLRRPGHPRRRDRGDRRRPRGVGRLRHGHPGRRRHPVLRGGRRRAGGPRVRGGPGRRASRLAARTPGPLARASPASDPDAGDHRRARVPHRIAGRDRQQRPVPRPWIRDLTECRPDRWPARRRRLRRDEPTGGPAPLPGGRAAAAAVGSDESSSPAPGG